MITIKAPAKINLMLRMIGRRADGYHLLCSIMQTVSLYDILHFEWLPQGQIELKISNWGELLPSGESNLVLRAVRVVEQEARKRGQHPKGCLIRLEKQIPIGAGLGGGSSNAAAALFALNHLWELNWSQELLAQLGGQIGADVPFFLYGGTAWVEGIGDRVQPLPNLPILPLTLAVPPFAVSTPDVYRAYDQSPSAPIRTREALWQEAKELLESMKREDWQQTAMRGRNDLQEAAIALFPSLKETVRQLEGANCPFVSMTGSGSAFFAFGCSNRFSKPSRHKIYSLHTVAEGVQIVNREELRHG